MCTVKKKDWSTAKITVILQNRSDLMTAFLISSCCWVDISEAYRKRQRAERVPGCDREAWHGHFWVLSGGDTAWSVTDISLQASTDCHQHLILRCYERRHTNPAWKQNNTFFFFFDKPQTVIAVGSTDRAKIYIRFVSYDFSSVIMIIMRCKFRLLWITSHILYIL